MGGGGGELEGGAAGGPPVPFLGVKPFSALTPLLSEAWSAVLVLLSCVWGRLWAGAAVLIFSPSLLGFSSTGCVLLPRGGPSLPAKLPDPRPIPGLLLRRLWAGAGRRGLQK